MGLGYVSTVYGIGFVFLLYMVLVLCFYCIRNYFLLVIVFVANFEYPNSKTIKALNCPNQRSFEPPHRCPYTSHKSSLILQLNNASCMYLQYHQSL